MAHSNVRTRAFIFTLNNYDDEQINHIQWLCDHNVLKYCVYGFEIAPETGTPHLQGYLNFKSQKTFTAACELIPGAHFALAKGTPEENRAYCLKIRSKDKVPNAKWFEFGEVPRQGKRTDLSYIRQRLVNGEHLSVVAGDCITVPEMHAVRFYSANVPMSPPERPACQNYWLYGPTGMSEVFVDDQYSSTYTPYDMFSQDPGRLASPLNLLNEKDSLGGYLEEISSFSMDIMDKKL